MVIIIAYLLYFKFEQFAFILMMFLNIRLDSLCIFVNEYKCACNNSNGDNQKNSDRAQKLIFRQRFRLNAVSIY